MQIILNGAPRECVADVTIASLMEEAGYGRRHVAVEVNREIVPRSLHIEYVLNENDRVEIVTALGGG